MILRRAKAPAVRQSIPLFGGQMLAGGMSPLEALRIPAVWACVSLIAESIASAQMLAEGGERSRLARIVRSPDGRPGMETWGTIAGWLALDGNAVCYKLRDQSGRAVGLIAYPPWQTQVNVATDGTATYWINGTRCEARDVLHIRMGLSADGVSGISPVAMNTPTLRRAEAIFEYVSAYYTNGATPGGTLTADGTLTPDQEAKLAAAWKRATGGAKRFSTPVLENGVKYNPGPEMDDGQGLAALVDAITTEIARIWHVPPTSIGLSAGKGLTYNNTNQVSEATYTQALLPVANAIERALTWDSDLGPQAVRFDFSGLLKADAPGRWAVYAAGLNAGVMTREWVAEQEGLPAPPEKPPVAAVPAPPQPNVTTDTEEGDDAQD